MLTIPRTIEANGVVVLRPEGRLNLTMAPVMRGDFQDLVNSGRTRVAVDMGAVESIDSAALGALIHGLKLARAAGGDVRIVAPAARVRTVLERTTLSHVLPAYRSVDEAFAEGGNPGDEKGSDR